MSQSVTLFRLMIASPGDVNTERMMLQDVIYKWNSNNTLEKSIVILPLMWEIDSPRGVADESQSLIDEHMLVNSDMVIGLFYSTLGRYGRTEYNTIGEIKKHIEKGTQVVLFFREPPIPAGYEQATEIAKVLDFKENLQSSLGIDAIYYDYKSESEFQEIGRASCRERV